MRVSLLLRREPFGSILAQTLSRFWGGVFGTTYEVDWSREGVERLDQRWLCNPWVNAIFVPGVNTEAFGPVRREFGRSNSPGLRLMQLLYVQAATRRPTAAWLARPVMGVSPAVPGARDLLVLGGNNRIRLLDLGQRRSYVVLKAAFSPQYLESEAALRQAQRLLPAPKLIEIAADQTWLAEEYVDGTPLNRVSTGPRASGALKAVGDGLQQLSDATEESKHPSAYAEELGSVIHALIDGHPWLDERGRSAMKMVVGESRRLVEEYAASVGEVSTVQSHGDFQPGNILVGDERSWLIDWEYTARRQRAYDPLVYALGTRMRQGQLGWRVVQALDGGLREEEMLLTWPRLQWSERPHRATALALFLLEEMRLRLDEASNPLFYGATLDFIRFQTDVQEASVALAAAAGGGAAEGRRRRSP